ncbi:hypothetical protein SO802_014350 [Lithocarpus litseifolius]|uniref:Uncharacterized protein n=1 Tax=Lithocarpus litseifolius TaxID=425828 RepID=A0AAW2CR86_9ROSI
MLLLELLTGQHSYDKIRLRNDKYVYLVAYMHIHAQGHCINEIVDLAMLVGEEGTSLERQLQGVQDLALRCTDEDPERRPTMVDAPKELKRIESDFREAVDANQGCVSNGISKPSSELLILPLWKGQVGL